MRECLCSFLFPTLNGVLQANGSQDVSSVFVHLYVRCFVLVKELGCERKHKQAIG